MTYLLIGGGIVVFLAVIVALAVQYGKAISKVDNYESQDDETGRARRIADAARARYRELQKARKP